MFKKTVEKLAWGLLCTILLFTLSYCINSNQASSQTKNDKNEGLTTAKSLGQAFVEVAKKVQPAVVNVTTEKTITMRPWEGYGEDFFRGSPFEDFFRGFGFSPVRRGRSFGKNRGEADQA